MRYEIHGITKTMVEFLPNEVQARVILLQGDAFIVSFPSSHNFHSGGHFVKLLSSMFDSYAPTADRMTIDELILNESIDIAIAGFNRAIIEV